MEDEKRETAPGPAGAELAYLPTRSDMAEALHARTPPAVLWRLPAAAVAGTVAVVAVLQLLEVPEGVLVVAATTGSLAALGGLVGGWVSRLHGVRRMTGYARAQGEYVMRVDDDGVRATTALVESRILWSSFRHYIETANLFVLVIDDTVGGMALLPKRGLRGGADVDEMRVIVARHLAPHPSGAEGKSAPHPVRSS
ncbi:YcxB family protein [Streptomyces sp. NEAU-W12]|uniref:YcxB family protein n=1 Tax=Streptomyces sp. NEAU-W12 TaxID=2994668 RepID=UPI00224AD91F|nr:YcxB family protein [Streptomyces sp. NEAU-W12]MCX2925480.1 YcxB family protein [Streptomyces sp. NEAU-W12]